MTVLIGRAKGSNSDVGVLHDAELESGNITVDQDEYTPGLDRVYDVKGAVNMHSEIENEGDTNGLTYRIEKARKNYSVLTELVDGDFNEEIKADTNVGVSVKAFGTVTCLGVLAGDTVTFNGLLYTAVAGAKADDTEFSIDTSDNACAIDLADSIDDDVRVGTLNDLTATATTNVVTAVQTIIGTGGNATTLVSSNGTRLAVSGPTFSGGVDTHVSDDIIDISPESTAIRIRVKRQTSGQDTTLAGIVSVN